MVKAIQIAEILKKKNYIRSLNLAMLDLPRGMMRRLEPQKQDEKARASTYNLISKN